MLKKESYVIICDSDIERIEQSHTHKTLPVSEPVGPLSSHFEITFND